MPTDEKRGGQLCDHHLDCNVGRMGVLPPVRKDWPMNHSTFTMAKRWIAKSEPRRDVADVNLCKRKTLEPRRNS